jgi:hypothetical protein
MKKMSKTSNLKTKMSTFLIAISFSSCGVGAAVTPAGNAACDARSKDYETAITAWSSEPTNASKCAAAKAATEKLLNACTLYTLAQKKQYEDALKDWKCN